MQQPISEEKNLSSAPLSHQLLITLIEQVGTQHLRANRGAEGQNRTIGLWFNMIIAPNGQEALAAYQACLKANRGRFSKITQETINEYKRPTTDLFEAVCANSSASEATLNVSALSQEEKFAALTILTCTAQAATDLSAKERLAWIKQIQAQQLRIIQAGLNELDLEAFCGNTTARGGDPKLTIRNMGSEFTSRLTQVWQKQTASDGQRTIDFQIQQAAHSLEHFQQLMCNVLSKVAEAHQAVVGVVALFAGDDFKDSSVQAAAQYYSQAQKTISAYVIKVANFIGCIDIMQYSHPGQSADVPQERNLQAQLEYLLAEGQNCITKGQELQQDQTAFSAQLQDYRSRQQALKAQLKTVREQMRQMYARCLSIVSCGDDKQSNFWEDYFTGSTALTDKQRPKIDKIKEERSNRIDRVILDKKLKITTLLEQLRIADTQFKASADTSTSLTQRQDSQQACQDTLNDLQQRLSKLQTLQPSINKDLCYARKQHQAARQQAQAEKAEQKAQAEQARQLALQQKAAEQEKSRQKAEAARQQRVMAMEKLKSQLAEVQKSAQELQSLQAGVSAHGGLFSKDEQKKNHRVFDDIQKTLNQATDDLDLVIVGPQTNPDGEITDCAASHVYNPATQCMVPLEELNQMQQKLHSAKGNLQSYQQRLEAFQQHLAQLKVQHPHPPTGFMKLVGWVLSWLRIYTSLTICHAIHNKAAAYEKWWLKHHNQSGSGDMATSNKNLMSPIATPTSHPPEISPTTNHTAATKTAAPAHPSPQRPLSLTNDSQTNHRQSPAERPSQLVPPMH